MLSVGGFEIEPMDVWLANLGMYKSFCIWHPELNKIHTSELYHFLTGSFIPIPDEICINPPLPGSYNYTLKLTGK